MPSLEEVYISRPFRTRNADEYELENILDIFVDPTDGLNRPFDYENIIVKGKMGSGKTMYLRANLAYYLYTLVADLIADNDIILPIYINLSECQNISDAIEIYEAIIYKIVLEMVEVCGSLSSAKKMAEIHRGFQNLGAQLPGKKGLNEVYKRLKLMTADEYVETVGREINTEGNVAYKFINLCKKAINNYQIEVKRCGKPQFEDIIRTYEEIIKPFSGKILILLDEVSSLKRSFFREDNGTSSQFEILMNQLRTLPFVRVKVAIYPFDICDLLMETRYGDNVQLDSDIKNRDYDVFFNKTITLVEKYLENALDKKVPIEELFDIEHENMGAIEQLIYASSGNMRRLIHLLDLAMESAFKRSNGKDKIKKEDVIEAICRQAEDCENRFQISDKEWLTSIVKVCRNRTAYRFTFPNRTVSLTKYTNRSSEYNIINKIENGQGRRSSTYEFDYAYCVYKEIPTHYLKNTERLDKNRSRETGEVIKKVTKITDTLIQQAVIPGKMEGTITYVNDKRDCAYVTTNDDRQYFFMQRDVIEDDRGKVLMISKQVKFVPVERGEHSFAEEVEIL